MINYESFLCADKIKIFISKLVLNIKFSRMNNSARNGNSCFTQKKVKRRYQQINQTIHQSMFLRT